MTVEIVESARAVAATRPKDKHATASEKCL
jgi:hypothetical protein